MKELRIAPYKRLNDEGNPTPADDLPDSVRAIAALRFGLFPEGAALFRFSGSKDSLRDLRQAKLALSAAFKVEKNGASTSWSVKPGGCFIRMDGAYHAALVKALDEAFQQGVPSTLIDGLVAAADWLKTATEVDPNKSSKTKAGK